MKPLRAHDHRLPEGEAVTAIREAVRELKGCVRALREMEPRKQPDADQPGLFDDDEWEYFGGA
jgi:hypothetical protein